MQPLKPVPQTPLVLSTLRNLLLIGILLSGLTIWIQREFALSMFFVWQVLAVFSLIVVMVLLYLGFHSKARLFGPANRITLARAALVALLIGFIGHAAGAEQIAWVIILLATLAMILDGLDGWLARRTNSVSAFGARFDMETDALLIMVLAILLWQAQKTGLWVLLAGGLRYLFIGAGYLLPWLNQPLPYSRRRQTVCVVQTLLLIVALSPPVNAHWAKVLAGLGLLLLTASFAVDTLWLIRHARHSTIRGSI